MITIQKRKYIPSSGELVPLKAGGRRGGLFSLTPDIY
jgi:hypothetical protein